MTDDERNTELLLKANELAAAHRNSINGRPSQAKKSYLEGFSAGRESMRAEKDKLEIYCNRVWQKYISRGKDVRENANTVRSIYRDKLEAERARSAKLADVIQHALDLGHLGEGSTAGWAKETLAEYEASRG